MAPPFCRFPLLEKQSEEVRLKELSAFAQFSVLWLWVRNHFLSLTCQLVCRWIKIVYVADINSRCFVELIATLRVTCRVVLSGVLVRLVKRVTGKRRNGISSSFNLLVLILFVCLPLFIVYFFTWKRDVKGILRVTFFRGRSFSRFREVDRDSILGLHVTLSLSKIQN